MRDVVEYNLRIPPDLIVFISGVPGVGKTTISYKLFNTFDEFRIIEETDLLRDALRGYNDYIRYELGDAAQILIDKIEIFDHTKILSIDEAKQQCRLMKNSFEQIIKRQQRKGIPSIVNGVHIIPEILNGIADNINIIYINLYISSEWEIKRRLNGRDQSKYTDDIIPFIYKANRELYLSTLQLSNNTDGYVFNNVDVTSATVTETLTEVIKCIQRRIDST